ncbi:MAG: ferritin family protein [Promethearchaeota archaeon]
MTQEKKEILGFLKEQIKLEGRIVKIAEKTVSKTENVLVREMIRGIALDSRKHANLITAMIGILLSKTPFLSVKERKDIGEGIKEHIKLEEKAIETYTDLLKQVENEYMRLLLKYLIADEHRHHELLTRIDKEIVEAETFTDEDVWDIMWKDSVFHGSPGG